MAPGTSALSFSAQKSFTEKPDFAGPDALFLLGVDEALASFFVVVCDDIESTIS